MTVDEIKEIFSNTKSDLSSVEGDNAFLGLCILNKYKPKGCLITGTDYDKILSLDLEELSEIGISEEDVRALRKLNWSIDNEGLYCFV
jgi:hypothetical protein